MRVNRDRLIRFLNPKSIAVVGGKESERVLEQCQKLGFDGPLWAVNPRRKSMAGIPCVSDLAELPGVPDAVFVGIQAEPPIEHLGILDRMGVGGAVCLASGFKEVGEAGEARQKRLVEAAGTMPVLGPNCYGFINTLLGAALFPDQHGLGRTEHGVAIISSSGNIGINFTLQQRALPIAWLVTVGNQAVIGIEDGVDAALENPDIRAIGLHVEGLGDLPRFIRLADRAREKGVPVIVLKTGKSEIGAAITRSHTATLAGEFRLYEALFRRLGIGQVDTVEEFLEALKLACIHGPLKGNRIASMSCSGGEASLIADLAMERDLCFPPLEPWHADLLEGTLNEYVSLSNPLDYHTFIWGDFERIRSTFGAMMRGGYDLIILIIDFPCTNDCDMSEWIETTRAFTEACRDLGAKGAVVTCLSESYTDEIRQFLVDNNVAPLHGMSQALAAIEALSQVGMAWDRPLSLPEISTFASPPDPGTVRGLDEHASKALLSAAGVRVPSGERVRHWEEGVRVAERVGYPVAIKAVDPELAHKSELGAVAIGISDEEECAERVRAMLETWSCLRIEKMVDDTVAELLVGVSHDALFGHYLVIGAGGTLVELIGDSRLLMLPVDERQIRAALQSLKTWPLLDGFRGRSKADVDAAVEAVKNVAGLIQAHGQDILELEINPLMVGASGAVAADALIRVNMNGSGEWACQNQ